MKTKHLTEIHFQRLRQHLIDNTASTHTKQRGFALCTLVLLETGIRAAELATLKVSDFLVDQSTLNITGAKGSHDRALRLSSDTAAALHAAIKSQGLIDTESIIAIIDHSYAHGHNASVRHAAKQALRVYWRAVRDTVLGADCQSLGLHCLRHTLAVRLLQHTGGNIIKARVALGHKSVSSTLRYSNYIDALDVQDDVLGALGPVVKLKIG